MTNPTYKAHGFSLDVETARRIKILARWLDRPESWVVRAAVNENFDRWAITEDGRQALEAAKQEPITK